MTSAIIISICVLLLIAYIFDVSSPKTRIPSVILLLLVGWAVRQGANFLGLHIPDLSPILPVIGTVGLILVVLEGSLEVELNRSKLGLIVRSTVVALLPIILLSMLLARAAQCYPTVCHQQHHCNIEFAEPTDERQRVRNIRKQSVGYLWCNIF